MEMPTSKAIDNPAPPGSPQTYPIAGQAGAQPVDPVIAGALTFFTLFKYYKATLTAENKSPRTIEGYGASLRSFDLFAQQTGLARGLKSFNKNTVTQYVLFIKERPKYTNHPTIAVKQGGISIDTIKARLRDLKAFSSWIYREGYTTVNELQGYKLPKGPKYLMKPLIKEEITKILRSFNLNCSVGFRNYVMVLLLLDTGLRATEITLIKISDINWSNGLIKVLGKGSKERTVALGDTTSRALTDYIKEHRDKVRHGDTDRLFLTKTGDPMTLNTVKLLFSRLKVSTGIPRLHAHLCRHSFATDFLNNGGNTLALQQILGHTSLAMVQEYVHFNQSQIVEQHRKYSPVDHYNASLGSEATNCTLQAGTQTNNPVRVDDRFIRSPGAWK